ncbi:histidine kinase [Alkalihalophilus pseudofirmus]|uniref:sensor histidine kinase n=1 Tax=Alkalihalophilus pseudofirmus TaxID=79885 RepID=UPI000952C57C|nr:PAS domain-containing sensor histidine kinase [Alkalihalophilus pseudofirmus]OLS36573.1 histidine kinase [Alkalihalophilus pseudofirmus]WEG17697.1 cache domain-containing protein [Alkalihalophilus pseudofirmus]
MLKTLRAKLLFFFLFATLLPLLFVGYITFQSQKIETNQQLQQTMYTMADNLAISIEEIVNERMADVTILANNTILRDSTATREEIREELRIFVNAYSIYYGALFVNPEGVVSVDLDNTIVGTDVTDRLWYQKAISQNGIYFSDIFYSDVLHQPAIVLASVVKDEDGEALGVVSAIFDVNFLWERLAHYSKQQKSHGLEGYAFLVNERGDIIAHPNENLILSYNYLEQNNLTSEAFDGLVQNRNLFHSKSNDMIQTFSRIAKAPGFDNEWYLSISVPNERMNSPIEELILKYLVLFGCVVLITSIGVIKLSSYIVKPLQKLVFATSDFAFGKKVYPLAPDAYHEVDTLTRTFNMMTRRLVEREKSHRKSTLILETTDNGVLAFQQSSQRVTTFNRQCEQLFGLAKEQALGATLDQVIEQNGAFKTFIDCSKLSDVLRNQDFNKKYEFECYLGGQKRIFFAGVSTLPKLNNEEELEDVLLIFIDITDKRKIEQELIRSEKLQLVGQLAAGFAHEIRNPLTTIRGFMQIFHQSDATKDEHKVHYDVIIKEIDRVNSIIGELLQMANPKSGTSKTETNIGEVLTDIHTLYEPEANEQGIKMRLQVEPLPTVYLDRSKLHQVVMNLVKNGLEAIDGSGSLALSAYENTEREIIEIKVEDTGIGMNPQTIEKLGTPFFTTKETGTGLGLMTSFRIVEEIGGKLLVTSKEGVGTTFMIQLPLYELKMYR